MSVPRIVVDTSALLAQARSGINDSSLWDAIRSERVVPLVSRATYEEFRDKLGDPRFGISSAARDTILAEYLRHAEYIRDVPDSGIKMNRDENDKLFVDLALAREAGRYRKRRLRLAGLQWPVGHSRAERNGVHKAFGLVAAPSPCSYITAPIAASNIFVARSTWASVVGNTKGTVYPRLRGR